MSIQGFKVKNALSFKHSTLLERNLFHYIQVKTFSRLKQMLSKMSWFLYAKYIVLYAVSPSICKNELDRIIMHRNYYFINSNNNLQKFHVSLTLKLYLLDN